MLKLYFENVEDYLDEYGTLTKTIIFSHDGEKLFSAPDPVEFSKRHYLAVLRCMADALHPLAGVIVGDEVYKCLRVGDTLLVGRSDTEEFVAYKGEEVLIVGFSDREKASDCCLTDVKNVERELYRAPEVEEAKEDQVPSEEEDAVVTQETMLQSTVAKPHQAKPKVMFSDRNSPAAERHVNSARKLPRGAHVTSGTDSDIEAVNEAFESSLDDADSSFDRIALDEVGAEVPRASLDEVDLRDVP